LNFNSKIILNVFKTILKISFSVTFLNPICLIKLLLLLIPSQQLKIVSQKLKKITKNSNSNPLFQQIVNLPSQNKLNDIVEIIYCYPEIESLHKTAADIIKQILNYSFSLKDPFFKIDDYL
jgi:hypothetical protein